MGAKRIIAVVGATGAQGGSVVRALFRDPSAFAVRALTRTPDSEAGRRLAQLGADVVRADADDLGSLKQAFAGAYGAYCVTNFWEHGSPDRECAQASSMAEAARCAGVQHVIWSTLEDTRRVMPLSDNRMPTLMGKFKVPHYDGKGEADDTFRRLSVPTTFLLTSFYWENFIRFPGMGLRKDPSGQLTLAMPLADKKMPGIAVLDIGLCAVGVFRQVCSTMGQTIGIAGEHVSGTEDVERSRQLNPSLQTFEEWLSRHAGEFTL
jgi:uncharacterized protein YbjT (DUF2867 family)